MRVTRFVLLLAIIITILAAPFKALAQDPDCVAFIQLKDEFSGTVDLGEHGTVPWISVLAMASGTSMVGYAALESSLPAIEKKFAETALQRVKVADTLVKLRSVKNAAYYSKMLQVGNMTDEAFSALIKSRARDLVLLEATLNLGGKATSILLKGLPILGKLLGALSVLEPTILSATDDPAYLLNHPEELAMVPDEYACNAIKSWPEIRGKVKTMVKYSESLKRTSAMDQLADWKIDNSSGPKTCQTQCSARPPVLPLPAERSAASVK